MYKDVSFSLFRRGIQALCVAFLVALLCFLQNPAAHASSLAPTSGGPGSVLQSGQLLTGGKDHRNQSAAWWQQKNTHPLIVPGSQYNLNFSPAQYVMEPPYTGTDSAEHGYTDEYFWNECGPGASTATLGYFSAVNLNRGTGTYSDPHATTTWNNTDDASYIQYVATQSYPPAFTSAGEMTYQGYPSAYAALNDVRDVLNWEGSGHSTLATSTVPMAWVA
jgi:hypothetical protein